MEEGGRWKLDRIDSIPGRRGAADGHADGQPDRQEPGRHPAVRLALGNTRELSLIEGASRSTRCRRSGVTGSSRTPASTRVRWPRRTSARSRHLLREQEIDHLVLTGQVTEQCILYSSLDAYVRHLGVTVVRDAVAHIDRE
ncbi:MAG: cysteine hydrolase family protein, partial [Thermoleophilaceae bacterium]